MDLNDIIIRVKQIALDAGEAIMEVYNDPANMGVVEKDDKSPLTLADQRSNRIICDALKKLTPETPIISEENKEIPYSARKKFIYSWLVDPVDGTKEFIKRNGEFTVNIALIHHCEIVLGVVFIPATNELFWALKGQGAYQSVLDGKPTKLQAQSFTIFDPGLSVVCSRSHLNEATADFIDMLNAPKKVSKGSSLKFLILAQGGAHVYPRLAPTMEWDTGAAQIILEEAGGKVIDNETKKALLYNKKNLRNPHFIAYANMYEQ